MVAGWEGEELIEAAVVGEEVFLDELFSGEVELRGVELEEGEDARVAVEAGTLAVGGEAEEGIEELCAVGEVGEEAVLEQAKGDPCERLLDGSESVGT
jgi:hypothetical protein